MNYSLTTRLAILQQSEYEWDSYKRWQHNNPGQKEEVKPKQWTLKLKLLRIIALVLGPIIGVDPALYVGLVLLSVPQQVVSFFLLSAATIVLRYYQARGLRVIAVCGSYAKTSTKTILAHVLSASYPLLVTPGNINRPIGFARLILQKLKPTHRFFIAEMGEYNRGEIAMMARFLKPEIVVITPIAVAHLERFAAVHDIEDEIFDALRTGKPHALVHESNKKAWERQKLDVPVTWYGKSQLTNIRVSRSGTEGTISVVETSVFLPLYGAHNVENALPAVLIGQQLKLDTQSIVGRLATLAPIPHRLEPTHLENNILLLDNGYNSNPESAKQALAVLQQLEGSQKIVFTPGFVELGDKQAYYNKELGSEIAKIADLAVVIQGVNTPALLDGLQEGGMREDQIVTAVGEREGMHQITSRVKPSAIILFENSVPELYKTTA